MTSGSPTILIADDARVNRTFMKSCLQGHGYRFVEAANGHEALAVLQIQTVDLIILDLMMPLMDGFTCLKHLKAEPRYAAIPVIVNSSLDDMGAIERVLTMGSYDYFIKSLPREVWQILLPLKARNAIQSKRLLDAVNAQKAVLEREIHMAGKYQRFLLPQHVRTPGMTVTQHFHPCIGVGGDFFDIVPLSGDQTALLMADVSGHGVLSAMIAAILKPLFGRYIRETESPCATLQRLNEDLLTLTDDASYITAFVAVYDPQGQTLRYANAGHPPALHLHTDAESIDALAATGTFLGMFSTEECELEEYLCPVVPGERLLLVTDGVICATTSAGGFFGLTALKTLLRSMARAPLEATAQRLWEELYAFAGGDFADDVTFLAIDFHGTSPPQVVHIPNDLSAVMRHVDSLLQALDGRLTPALYQAIKISLVEVITNAIEHGNLEIGYACKHATLGTGTFEAMVLARCQQEPYTSRQVTVEYALSATHVTFTIRDGGPGFDWQAYLPSAGHGGVTEGAPELHGRGLLIAQSCMDICRFNAQGNAVTLVKCLRPVDAATSHRPGTRSEKELKMDELQDTCMHIGSTRVGQTMILALSGVVSFAARQTLRTSLEETLAAGCLEIVLDLQRVSFMDSSGLGALVACFSTLRKQGGSLKLARVPQQVEELLEMTRLSHFFERCASFEHVAAEVGSDQ